MEKMIRMIDITWRNRYVIVEDQAGADAAGVVKHISWYVPSDYYANGKQMPLVQVELAPMNEEDAEVYGANEDGMIVKCFDPMTLVFKPLDNNGNYINPNDHDSTL